MTVMQVAFISLAGGKFRRFMPVIFIFGRAAGANGALRNANEGYVHHPRYTGCLHRNRMCTHRSLLVYFYPPNL